MKDAAATSEHPQSPLFRGEVAGLLSRYWQMKTAIQTRLEEFRKWGRESDERMFSELCFCLLTPQTRARVCEKVVTSLVSTDLLMNGSQDQVQAHLKGVRFSHGKARYIISARSEFCRGGQWTLKKRLDEFRDSFEAREWLVANILGLGYKEAAHYLRNIGKGENLAILDRHILKNLLRHGVIDKIPDSLSRKEYIRIEGLMRDFSKRIGIPLAHLDLLFWSLETGEIFK